MATKRVLWTRQQRLVAFRLYCRTPFGRLHRGNPEIIELARFIGRTPSAVAMKAVNFASLDPVHQARDIAGLGNASDDDAELWAQFHANPEAIAAEAEAAYAQLAGRDAPPLETELDLPDGPTEVMRTVRTRRVQSFFRAAVLTTYDGRCALTGIAAPDLLVASHIIPWKDSVERRADPRNGICLNALFDRAFDRGFITFDDDFRVRVSPRLGEGLAEAQLDCSLAGLSGTKLTLPNRFPPDLDAIRYHRQHIYQAA